jgi:hypothetical protein
MYPINTIIIMLPMLCIAPPMFKILTSSLPSNVKTLY